MGKVDYNTFIAMLSELNDFIYKWDRDYVLEVKAIGGFAIIVHRQMKHIDTPRTESRDIDSLTKDYPEPIISICNQGNDSYLFTDAFIIVTEVEYGY